MTLREKQSAGRVLAEMGSPLTRNPQQEMKGSLLHLSDTNPVEGCSGDHGEFSFCFGSEAIYTFLGAKVELTVAYIVFPVVIHSHTVHKGKGTSVTLRRMKVTPTLIFNLPN